jgi:hypothetical protein
MQATGRREGNADRKRRRTTMTRNRTHYTAALAGTILLIGTLTIPMSAQADAGKGPSGNQGSGITTYLATLPVEQVSTDEIAGLLFTREEEKLARDVYTELYAKWNLRIFRNIARSEQSHMDAVQLMIDRYEIADPSAGLPAGSFFDVHLQLLYDELVAKGSLSIVDALTVGAAIEDLDVSDVTALLESSDNVDLDTVYQNLAKGSRNHLRAFVDNLAVMEVTYVPAYLDQETFDAIVASDIEHGIYDAEGNPIATGTGPGNGSQGGNGNAGSGGNGNCTGDGTCDGSCDGSGNQGGNGNQGGRG